MPKNFEEASTLKKSNGIILEKLLCKAKVSFLLIVSDSWQDILHDENPKLLLNAFWKKQTKLGSFLWNATPKKWLQTTRQQTTYTTMDMASSIQALASSLATTFASRELLYLDHYKRGALTLYSLCRVPKVQLSALLLSLQLIFYSHHSNWYVVEAMPMIYRVVKKVWNKVQENST